MKKIELNIEDEDLPALLQALATLKPIGALKVEPVKPPRIRKSRAKSEPAVA